MDLNPMIHHSRHRKSNGIQMSGQLVELSAGQHMIKSLSGRFAKIMHVPSHVLVDYRCP